MSLGKSTMGTLCFIGISMVGLLVAGWLLLEKNNIKAIQTVQNSTNSVIQTNNLINAELISVISTEDWPRVRVYLLKANNNFHYIVINSNGGVAIK